MAERKNPFRNIKVIVQPGTRKLKIVWILLIVFAMAALIMLGMVRSSIQAQTQKLLGDAAALEEQNADLEEKIGDLGSQQSIEDIAREELDLVDPDTVIINPESQ